MSEGDAGARASQRSGSAHARAFDPSNDTAIPGFDAARCAEYEQATAHRGPREWLVRALDQFLPAPTASGAEALDLGCGPGKECELLLERGWRVTATDSSARMLQLALDRAKAIGAESRLELIHAPFDRTPLPPGRFELVHAGMVLPFCPAEHFRAVWRTLVESMTPDGLFVGQLFGPDDDFVRRSPPGTMSAHDAAAVTHLLDGFEVLAREEANRTGEMTPGSPKHWHVHHLVARRCRIMSPTHSQDRLR